jgi:SAM-dependent methyltransferase
MRTFRDAYLIGVKGQSLKILDVGAASIDRSETYRDLFSMPGWEYVALDVELGANVNLVVKDPYSWRELSDANFDVVVSGQAFEHIEWPWLTIKEVARVLKPRGIAALTAPSSGHPHRYPTDCWRYYPDGFPALAKYANLSVIENDVDFGFVFKECAQWGDAFTILQKPAQSQVEAGDVVEAPFDSPLVSVDAIARSYELERQEPAGLDWRLKLARHHFRSAFMALFMPQRLRRW